MNCYQCTSMPMESGDAQGGHALTICITTLISEASENDFDRLELAESFPPETYCRPATTDFSAGCASTLNSLFRRLMGCLAAGDCPRGGRFRRANGAYEPYESAAPKPGDKRIDLDGRNAEDRHVDQVIKLEVITGGIEFVPMRPANTEAGRLPRVGLEMAWRLADGARAARRARLGPGMRLVPLTAVFAIVSHRLPLPRDKRRAVLPGLTFTRSWRAA